LRDLARPILQAGIQSSHWGHWSQLKAICILAQWGYSGYLEEVIGTLKSALSQDHQEEAKAALEALAMMQDKRAIPILIELLKHLSRGGTPLENLRHAFRSDRIPIQEAILTTLKALGQPMYFDALKQQWLPEQKV